MQLQAFLGVLRACKATFGLGAVAMYVEAQLSRMGAGYG